MDAVDPTRTQLNQHLAMCASAHGVGVRGGVGVGGREDGHTDGLAVDASASNSAVRVAIISRIWSLVNLRDGWYDVLVLVREGELKPDAAYVDE